MPSVIENPRRTRRGGERPGVDLTFSLLGYATEGDAETALLAEAPTSVGVFVRKSWSVREIGGSNWEGVVSYSRSGTIDKEPPETGYSEFAFDLTGGTQRIQQSLATVASFTNLPISADFGRAIGVTRNGDTISVEGVDVVVPEFNYSETHYIAAATVTNAYVQTLKALVGTVNDAPFKGFAAGEVLFLGARGSRRGPADWRIDFLFKIEKNVTGVSIGAITGISKKGHEYLWVLYEDAVDTAAKMLVRKPQIVYVEQVYETADHSLIGI